MQVLKVNAQRPALEFEQADGSKVRWEYDVIVLKLEMERLDSKHGIDSGKVERLPIEYLTDFAECLVRHGTPVHSLDLAMRLHSLVLVQFRQLSRSIIQQVHEIQKGQS